MESLTGPDFKTEALKEICEYRDNILKFVHETFSVAEGAVKKVLHRDAAVVDFIKNLEESTLLLKICRERLAVVDGHLPTEPFPNQNVLLPTQNQPMIDVIPKLAFKPPSPAVITQIPVVKVIFNEAYKVEIIDGDVGSPTLFWLKLLGSSSRRMEEELMEAYRFHPKIEELPILGTFVVCKSDNKFCRAKVVTIVECKSREASTVEVILVDYGQTKTASLSDLYPIESRFCVEPAIGLLCGLKDIQPVQGDFWEMGSIIFFNELCRDDLTVIFHSPTEELTETFSKFQPDFWVSLHKKGALKGMVQDIRFILIKEGMAKDGSSDPKPDFPVWSLGDAPSSARPMSASSNQFISPAPPSLPRPSSKQLISPAPPSLPRPSSKQHISPAPPSLTRPSSKQHISPATSSLTRPTSSSKQLNINAPEFVLPKEKQARLLGHSSNSSSLLSCKSRVHDFIPDTSSGFVPRKPLSTSRSSLRAQSVKKFGSSSDVTPSSLRSSVVDGEVDAIMKKTSPPPQTIPEKQDTSEQLDEEADPVPVLHRPVDRLLMDQFLQSLDCRPTTNSDKSVGSDGLSRMSFVSAATHISKRSESSFDESDKQKSVRIHLDYQYGKVLERRPLPSSTKLTVQLSYVFHPNHFYVHIKDEVPTMVEPLVKRLNELYRHSEPVPVQCPEIGSFWVAKEKTMNNWARVLVVEVNVVKGVTKVTVLSVDWGFVEVVELSQLRPLVSQVSEMPCLALCFRLAGVYPFNQSMDSEDWPKEATDTFVKWATSEDDFLALIEDRDQRDGQWSVLMFKGLGEDEMTLNELLVNLKLASSTIFPLGTHAVQPKNENEQCLLDQEFPNWDPMAADFYSSRNTTAIDMENYDSATAGHIPRDDEEICRFFRANGSCPRGIRCGLKHIQPNSNTFTQDKMVVFIDLPVLASPIPGSTILLHVTCVSRSYRFYCVLPHGPRDLRKTLADVNEDSETLETLQVAIQKEYNENHQLHRVTLNPSAGDIVIARSPDDKMWYRGRVMEELENEAFAVFFVDFGNKRPVPMKDVCLPLNRFTHLPMQAVEMFLNGIDRKSDTIGARDELVNLVKGKDLVAHVIHDNPVLLVDLYDTSGPRQVDIAEELIRRRVVNRGPSHKLNLSTRGQFIAG